jgi:hypothetical protein
MSVLCLAAVGKRRVRVMKICGHFSEPDRMFVKGRLKFGNRRFELPIARFEDFGAQLADAIIEPTKVHKCRFLQVGKHMPYG